jgi:hypothetical protein
MRENKSNGPPPRVEVDFTPEQIAAASVDMERILEQEPELSDYGYGNGGFSKTPEERAVRFQENLKLIREPRLLAQFLAARRWLRRFSKLKSFNKRGTSYGLKHVAAHDMGYVTNGVFIAAAIARGQQPQRRVQHLDCRMEHPPRSTG